MATSAAYIDYDEGTAPATPGTGKVRTYAKTDGKLYSKDDLGTESDLTSGGSGISRGSSFPGSPSTGDLYQRSDLDEQVFVYDGTRWVTQQIFVWDGSVFDTTTDGTVITLTGFDDTDGDIYLIDWQGVMRQVTGDGSNYWTLTLYKSPPTGGDTSLGTADLSAASAATYVEKVITIDAVQDISAHPSGFWYLTKTGSPGAGRAAGQLRYRKIAT